MQSYAGGLPVQPGISGLAVASLVCGTLGLVSFCLLLPSVLGIVFGAVALPMIKRGEARGKGLAISGIVTAIVGLILGVCIWTLFLLSPDIMPVKGAQVSTSVVDRLRSMGALHEGEDIEYLCPTGWFTIAESGLIITDQRLVIYDDHGNLESCDLVDVVAIEFDPSVDWFDDGQFVIELENGDELFFLVSAEQGGDKMFDRHLRRKVTEARRAAAKAAPKSELTPLTDDENP